MCNFLLVLIKLSIYYISRTKYPIHPKEQRKENRKRRRNKKNQKEKKKKTRENWRENKDLFMLHDTQSRCFMTKKNLGMSSSIRPIQLIELTTR